MVRLAPERRSPCPARPRMEMLGVFGSGKTTLAKRLAVAGFELQSEHPIKNPFWTDGHAAAVAGPLAYDLGFLLQHAYLAAQAPSPDASSVALCDWSFASDRLWASMRLAIEMPTYDAVHEEVCSRLGPPLGYLYLRQKEEMIAARIRRRGIPAETPLLGAVGTAVVALEQLVEKLPAERTRVVGDDVGATEIMRLVEQWRDAW